MNAASDYLFSQPGLFVIPIEHLSADGVSEHMQQQILDRNVLDAASMELLQTAYRKYWQRAQLLFNTAPEYWFPPRVQHLCIVTDTHLVRPYSQPFNKNAWLLYRDDFSPESSSLELVIYLLLQVERMWLLQQIDPVLYANLSYLLVLKPGQLADLQAGCLASTRPDSAGFRALADALPWIKNCHHKLLRPVQHQDSVSYLPDTGLYIPGQQHADLAHLQRLWSGAVRQAEQDYRQQQPTAHNTAQSGLLDWLAQQQPQLVITGPNESVLWHPEAQGTGELFALLSRANTAALDSITSDLKVIDACSRQFFDALIEPQQLARPAAFMSAGGLCHIHAEHQQIAYSLNPELHPDRLWQPAQPYERLMLAARCMHEWGHLAAESGWVLVAVSMQPHRQQASEQLIQLFEQIFDRTPTDVHELVSSEVERLRGDSGSLGESLLNKMLVRVEDFQANLVASRLLPADAMQTYVRNNVYAHWQDYSADGLYMLLLRYAYEFQYLRFMPIDDPMRWFLSSTWFGEYYLQRRILTLDQFEQLTVLIGQLCDCYQIDRGMLAIE